MVTFKVSSSDEDSWNGTEYVVTEEFYPSRKTGRESAFGHLRLRNPAIPREVHISYLEVITSINNSMLLLAAVGIRLIIEAICRKEKCAVFCEKNKLKPNLKNQINALVAKEVITGKQAKVLHKPRFLGNNAAHEILVPTEAEILAALDIAELMLRTIYMLDSLGKRITSIQKTERQEARYDRKRAAKKAVSLTPPIGPAKP